MLWCDFLLSASFLFPSQLRCGERPPCRPASSPTTCSPPTPNTQSLGSDPTFNIQIQGLTVPPSFPPPSFPSPCGWKGHPYQASGFMSCPLGWVLWQAAARPRCPELLLMTLLLGNPGGTPLATTLKINFVKYLLARVLHLPLRNSSDLDSGTAVQPARGNSIISSILVAPGCFSSYYITSPS